MYSLDVHFNDAANIVFPSIIHITEAIWLGYALPIEASFWSKAFLGVHRSLKLK